jgi:mono/diheme cytochrome c family protein
LSRSRLVAEFAAALMVVFAAGCADRHPSPPRLYKAFCARCHGVAGEGDARSLRLHPGLDLRSSPMVVGGDRGLIRQRIAAGKGPMPGFAHRLSPAEIDALVELTLTFANRQDGER